MIGLQITERGKITKVNKMEMCENVDTSKVKITKVLLTPEDIFTLFGDDQAKYPIIPGHIGLGQVSDASANAYLGKGTRVYVSPVSGGNSCEEGNLSNAEYCANFKRAGKDTDGFLRDFAVVNNTDLYALPGNVSDSASLLIDYIALALSCIDKLNILKGEHVAVIGGGVIGTIISLLIIYYQGVPILIDSKQEHLDRAKQEGIYYNLFSDNKVEREVLDRTGAHMAKKVVYVADSNINTDLAIKLASHGAKVGFVGFSAPTLKVNFSLAMRKQLQFVCITSGYGFTEQAINILANRVLDLSFFNFQVVKYEHCEAFLKKLFTDNKTVPQDFMPVIIDMM